MSNPNIAPEPEYLSRVERVEAAAQRLNETETPNLWPRLELALRRRARPRRAGLATVTAVAAFAAIGFIGLRPTPAYGMLEKMRQAVEQQHSVHQTMWWRHENRPLKEIEEMWFDHGSWRRIADGEMGGDRIFLTRPDGVHYFKRIDGKVADMHELAPQPDKFDLDTLAPDFFPTGITLTPTMDGTLSWRGKTYNKVVISTSNQSERMVCYVVPGTNLPVHLEKYDRDRFGYTLFGMIDLEFDPVLPVGIFDPQRLR